MADVTGEEPAFLIAAVRHAVARNSIRAVARQTGMSHGGVHNLVAGRTRCIYGASIVKLRSWYLRQWAGGGDGLTPDVAAYLVGQVLAVVPLDGRSGAVLELMDALEGIYQRHGAKRPVWLSAVRDDYTHA